MVQQNRAGSWFFHPTHTWQPDLGDRQWSPEVSLLVCHRSEQAAVPPSQVLISGGQPCSKLPPQRAASAELSRELLPLPLPSGRKQTAFHLLRLCPQGRVGNSCSSTMWQKQEVTVSPSVRSAEPSGNLSFHWHLAATRGHSVRHC